jgi:hypothetical protein
MTIDKLCRTHGLDEVKKGECGPQLKKCLHDVIKDLGHLNEVDMKEQITLRMTKQNDAPGSSPHYSTQDSKLIRHTIAGLIGFVSDDLRNEWNEQANPHIVVGDQITGDHHLQNCDCAVEITSHETSTCCHIMDTSPTRFPPAYQPRPPTQTDRKEN